VTPAPIPEDVMPARRVLAMLAAGCVLLTGCTGGSEPDDTDSPGGNGSGGPVATATATTSPLTAPVTIAAGASAADLSITTSRALFETAPVVLLARADDISGQAVAATAAVRAGIPLLVLPAPVRTPPIPSPTSPGASTSGPSAPPADERLDVTQVSAELTRLHATIAVAVGATLESGALGEVTVLSVPSSAQAVFNALTLSPGVDQAVPSADLVSAVAGLDPTAPVALSVSDAPPATQPNPPVPSPVVAVPPLAHPAPVPGLTVLSPTDPFAVGAVATARAAGARVLPTDGGDPRASADVIDALASSPPTSVLALGDGFGSVEQLSYRLSVAVTGVQLPGGGQIVFPGRRMVALYGNPTTPSLGVLGEQGLDASITRAQQTAAQYDGLFGTDPVIPTFEIIATVASAFPGPDRNYSTEMGLDVLRPWVEKARDSGVYVMLDLQPGRSDFLSQAKLYESLLLEPNVGLAIDPEWRLGPNQLPLQQIGSVGVDEINSVITWLADLTRDHNLPQKIFMLHQFKLSMIEGRDRVDTSRDELSVLIHADGNGPPGSKYATYNALTASPPPNVRWGWKNFYDEDSPTFTPQQTAAVDPTPVFVSYQ
jgi:hypothetical protein